MLQVIGYIFRADWWLSDTAQVRSTGYAINPRKRLYVHGVKVIDDAPGVRQYARGSESKSRRQFLEGFA